MYMYIYICIYVYVYTCKVILEYGFRLAWDLGIRNCSAGSGEVFDYWVVGR